MAGKPTIVPRKPGHLKVTDGAAAQRFLEEAAERPSVGPLEVEPSVSGSQGGGQASVDSAPAPGQLNASRKRTLTRSRDGKVVRQVTAYLPVDLAKVLAHHCAEYDLDKSEVIVVALQALLQK